MCLALRVSCNKTVLQDMQDSPAGGTPRGGLGRRSGWRPRLTGLFRASPAPSDVPSQQPAQQPAQQPGQQPTPSDASVSTTPSLPSKLTLADILALDRGGAARASPLGPGNKEGPQILESDPLVSDQPTHGTGVQRHQSLQRQPSATSTPRRSLQQIQSMWRSFTKAEGGMLHNLHVDDVHAGCHNTGMMLGTSYTAMHADENDDHTPLHRTSTSTSVQHGFAKAGCIGLSPLCLSPQIYLLRQKAQQLSQAQRDASWVFKYLLIYQVPDIRPTVISYAYSLNRLCWKPLPTAATTSPTRLDPCLPYGRPGRMVRRYCAPLWSTQ